MNRRLIAKVALVYIEKKKHVLLTEKSLGMKQNLGRKIRWSHLGSHTHIPIFSISVFLKRVLCVKVKESPSPYVKNHSEE
ncbi:Uncharacterized protein TCM_006648 [Theobroma cacao]|uniref:Uncharacterized protein n=1 Tax=Theobroma cacao TaxID=3641 RepID=A0A061DY92_THECC|nr:Uncharacterized protein TCM_006648 [Theobroma cacao]